MTRSCCVVCSWFNAFHLSWKALDGLSGIFYVKPDWLSTSGFFVPEKIELIVNKQSAYLIRIVFGLVSGWQAGAANIVGVYVDGWIH